MLHSFHLPQKKRMPFSLSRRGISCGAIRVVLAGEKEKIGCGRFLFSLEYNYGFTRVVPAEGEN